MTLVLSITNTLILMFNCKTQIQLTFDALANSSVKLYISPLL